MSHKEANNMKAKWEFFSILVLTTLLISCVTGQYMEMKPAENVEVLGTIQTTFYVNGSFRYRRTINSQAYITLLTEAQKQFHDINIDIRDISWVIGRQIDASNNYEYSAIGKVVKPQKNP
jgi:hypothetical protein